MLNIYKFHSNPDELIGYTDRNFYFGDEAKELILQGKEVTKNVVGTLYLSGTAITALPDNLTVHGTLDLNGTAITALPDNLKVGEDLYLDNTPITSLPDNLTVGEDLYLRRTQYLDKNNLPSSLVVKGNIIK